MKKILAIISVLFLLPIMCLAQTKPIEIVNSLDKYITIKFQIDGCSGYSTDVHAGETEVLQVKSTSYYKITIFYYADDRERTVYLLTNSSIPYYSKDKSVEGTKITVKSKIGINPASDIKYGTVDNVTRSIGCIKRKSN